MREVATAAALGYATLPVRARPRVAILATGDELVPPGTTPGPDQIVATNALAIAAHVRVLGGEPIDLGIARDDMTSLDGAIGRALAADPDVLITIGGASVGDHDLVRPALTARSLALDFWRIAMRPGKPLMFGRMTAQPGRPVRVLGFPGNPASSIVCSLLFLTPLVDALLGRPPGDLSEPAVSGADLAENDDRQDYLRARLASGGAGLPVATAAAPPGQRHAVRVRGGRLPRDPAAQRRRSQGRRSLPDHSPALGLYGIFSACGTHIEHVTSFVFCTRTYESQDCRRGLDEEC